MRMREDHERRRTITELRKLVDDAETSGVSPHTVPKIMVAVEDTGPGVSSQHQRLIFEKFYQVHHTLSDKDRGSGLGLYLSRSFAELHGGSLVLEDLVGDGCRFVLEVPIVQSETT